MSGGHHGSRPWNRRVQLKNTKPIFPPSIVKQVILQENPNNSDLQQGNIYNKDLKDSSFRALSSAQKHEVFLTDEFERIPIEAAGAFWDSILQGLPRPHDDDEKLSTVQEVNKALQKYSGYSVEKITVLKHNIGRQTYQAVKKAFKKRDGKDPVQLCTGHGSEWNTIKKIAEEGFRLFDNSKPKNGDKMGTGIYLGIKAKAPWIPLMYSKAILKMGLHGPECLMFRTLVVLVNAGSDGILTTNRKDNNFGFDDKNRQIYMRTNEAGHLRFQEGTVLVVNPQGVVTATDIQAMVEWSIELDYRITDNCIQWFKDNGFRMNSQVFAILTGRNPSLLNELPQFWLPAHAKAQTPDYAAGQHFLKGTEFVLLEKITCGSQVIKVGIEVTMENFCSDQVFMNGTQGTVMKILKQGDDAAMVFVKAHDPTNQIQTKKWNTKNDKRTGKPFEDVVLLNWMLCNVHNIVTGSSSEGEASSANLAAGGGGGGNERYMLASHAAAAGGGGGGAGGPMNRLRLNPKFTRLDNFGGFKKGDVVRFRNFRAPMNELNKQPGFLKEIIKTDMGKIYFVVEPQPDKIKTLVSKDKKSRDQVKEFFKNFNDQHLTWKCCTDNQITKVNPPNLSPP